MTLITDACLYSKPGPSFAWLNVKRIPLPGNLTAYQFIGNKNQVAYPDGKFASARALGEITAVSTIGDNELFEETSGLAKVLIGEGYRVIKVA